MGQQRGRKTLSEEEKNKRLFDRKSLSDWKEPKKVVVEEEQNLNNNKMADENKDIIDSKESTENTNNGNNAPLNNEQTPSVTTTVESVAPSSNPVSEAKGVPPTPTPTPSNYTPNTTWKPFGGDKIERDYSTPTIDEKLLHTPIPEINIGSQNIVKETPTEILNKAPVDNSVPQKPVAPTPVVSDWNTLTEKEKSDAAAQTTDMILGVYDKLHYFARSAIKVDDEKILEDHAADKINMYEATVECDDDPEKEVTIQDFWKDFNKQVDERFVVSDQFKQAVRPPMERMCMKYGLGASDGLFLAYKFGEDAATKIAMVVGFKKTVNNMTEMFEKRHAKFKAEVDAEVQRQMKAANKETAKTNETVIPADTTANNNTSIPSETTNNKTETIKPGEPVKTA